MSVNNIKKDTPIKKPANSNLISKKEPTISDVWNLLASVNSTVSSHNMHFTNINTNLQSLESNFNSMQTSLNDLRKELSKLKSDKIALETELALLRDKFDKFENSPSTQSPPYSFDVYTKVRDRMSRDKNILVFNVPDSVDEDLNVSLNIGVDLFKDLSLPSIKIIRSKRLGKFSTKNRPILFELDSPSNVFEILKTKSKLRLIDRWRNVSISEDGTAWQRAHINNLRPELSEKRSQGENNWFIKYNRSIPYLAQKT